MSHSELNLANSTTSEEINQENTTPIDAPVLNRAQRKKALAAANLKAITEQWERFNHASNDHPLPLSITIREEIQEDIMKRGLTISEAVINAGLAAYTQRMSYIRALTKGGARYDLFGKEKGEVTPEHQEQANETRLKSKERHARKNKKKLNP